MERTRPIVVVITGEPVPSVLERRGDWARIVREALGDAWTGPVEAVDVRGLDGTLPAALPDPRSASAFVVSGSAANVPNREPWMLHTEGYLREIVGAGTPTLGICFGHQLLGQALGGEVRKNPRGREMGTIAIRKTASDPLFDPLPDTFHANVTHVDTVSVLPKGAVKLAESDGDEHHAVRFADGVYGVQFHPEIDADVMREYVAHRSGLLRDEGFDVPQIVARIGEGEHGREVLRAFVRRFVAPRERGRP